MPVLDSAAGEGTVRKDPEEPEEVFAVSFGERPQGENDVRSVKAAAKRELGRLRGVEGVGVGDGCLRVYVRSAEVREELPESFRGVPVEPVVVGDVRALDDAP
ncbi:hypothetical protein SAMN00767673_3191 [Rubrobacter radiotolerans DSM 5868]|nr:hypothetical protein SAMN00767673_3191 [Rubrobacter radiotolerans DSM 5868]